MKGHSETSTLSSQPSIDEVRQQMHMLLEEAFSLASAGHAGQSRHQEAYGSAQHLPYSEVVTSAPGTMTRPRAGVQWVPTYRPEMYQYSLPRPVSQTSLPHTPVGQLCPVCSRRGLWCLGENHLGIWRQTFLGSLLILHPRSKTKPVGAHTQEALISNRNTLQNEFLFRRSLL